MRELDIIRGPSGCGKSTWIRQNAPEATVISADHFFEFGIGFDEATTTRNPTRKVVNKATLEFFYLEYRFDPTKLGKAHAWCLGQFIEALHGAGDEDAHFVLDNTNVHTWEYENYVRLAEDADFKVRIIEFQPVTIEHLNLCASRNTHKVPKDIVAKMCYEFEHDERAEVQEIVI